MIYAQKNIDVFHLTSDCKIMHPIKPEIKKANTKQSNGCTPRGYFLIDVTSPWIVPSFNNASTQQ